MHILTIRRLLSGRKYTYTKATSWYTILSMLSGGRGGGTGQWDLMCVLSFFFDILCNIFNPSKNLCVPYWHQRQNRKSSVTLRCTQVAHPQDETGFDWTALAKPTVPCSEICSVSFGFVDLLLVSFIVIYIRD